MSQDVVESCSMTSFDYDYRSRDCVRDVEKILENSTHTHEFVETLSTRKDELDFVVVSFEVSIL